MEDKILKVLVVDDVKENRESARKYLENTTRILQNLREERGYNDIAKLRYNIPSDFKKDINLKIDDYYAENASEAIEILKNKNIEFIVSDVFFDYDKDGTPSNVREELAKELGPYGVLNSEKLEDGYKRRFENEEWIKKHRIWVKGNSEPPMGVYLAKQLEIINPRIAIGFNTKQMGHGILAEPINKWSWDKGIECMQDYSPHEEPKNWEDVLETTILFGEYQIKQRD